MKAPTAREDFRLFHAGVGWLCLPVRIGAHEVLECRDRLDDGCGVASPSPTSYTFGALRLRHRFETPWASRKSP